MDNSNQTPGTEVSATKQKQPVNLLAKLSSVTGLGVASIILGILVPPLGLLLAIITLYRAGRSSNKLVALLGILGLGAVVAGSFMYTQIYENYNEKKNTKPSVYQNYEDYKLFGLGVDRGVSFSKPVDFKDISGESPTWQAIFVHSVDKLGQDGQMSNGGLIVMATSPSQELRSEYLKVLKEKYIEPAQSSGDSEAFKASLEQLIKSKFANQGQFNLSAVKPFTNDFVKGNSYQYDVTAQNTSVSNKKLKLKGKLIYLIGEKTYYYFILFAPDYNWDANSSTWQKVVDSIKIDQ